MALKNAIRTAVLLFLLGGHALAQPAKPATAQSLAEQGLKWIQEGKSLEGCAFLEKSHQLRPDPKLAYNLANCNAELGNLWGAHRYYSETLRSTIPDEVRKFAEQKRQELASKLPRLVIKLPAEMAALPDLMIRVNQEPVELAKLGEPLLIEPGKWVEVDANAPRHIPWSLRFLAPTDGQIKTISVPTLKEEQAPRAVDPCAGASPDPRRCPALAPRRKSGFPSVLWISGGGLLVLGGVLVGMSSRAVSDAEALCVGGCAPDTNVGERLSSAKTLGVLGALSMAVGGGLGAAGLVLQLQPSGSASAAAPAGLGLGWRGRW